MRFWSELVLFEHFASAHSGSCGLNADYTKLRDPAMTTLFSSFADIEAALAALPDPDAEAIAGAQARDGVLTFLMLITMVI